MIDFFRKTTSVTLPTGRKITVKRAGIAAYFSLIETLMQMGNLRWLVAEDNQAPGELMNQLKSLIDTEQDFARIIDAFLMPGDFKPEDSGEIVREILKFNTLENVSVGKNGNAAVVKIGEIGESAVRVMAIIAERTGWTLEYIAEMVSFSQAQALMEAWKDSRCNAIMDQAVAFGGKIEEYTDAIRGIKKISLSQFDAEMRAKYGDQPVN
jgi:hypothetical protein